jgi:hypothetical protein
MGMPQSGARFKSALLLKRNVFSFHGALLNILPETLRSAFREQIGASTQYFVTSLGESEQASWSQSQMFVSILEMTRSSIQAALLSEREAAIATG